MRGEIIAIGDELTSGRILNTTSSFAAGHLYGAGYDIVSISTVGDDPAAIEASLGRALDRADFLIVTGGLGATSDDLTNEAVSRILHRPPTFYPEIFAKLQQSATPESLCVGEGAKDNHSHPLAKLAWLPEGSRVLKPEARMAGHFLVHEGIPIFFLPGVPHEMKELMLDCVLPYLAAWKGEEDRLVRQNVYRVFGVSEIEINEKLQSLEKEGDDLRIGYYPVYPEVHVSLTVVGTEETTVNNRYREADAAIYSRLFPYLYGYGDQSLEKVVGRLLREKGLKLATGESCTGGLVASKLTEVPGSSHYFVGGIVAYSNTIKEKILGVPGQIIEQHGAVSSETAAAMAEGACTNCQADIGIGITGIAGPEGGSEEKPVGLVYIGIASGSGTATHRFIFRGDRHKIQKITALTALDLVRRLLLCVCDPL